MNRFALSVTVLALAAGVALAGGSTKIVRQFTADAPKPDKDGWYTLFNGKNLEGWKPSENKDCFKVADGCLVAHGKRSHLYYDGPVCGHDFKNFEFVAEVKTFPKSNSGIYLHTVYQEKGWPGKGYECQVNATHSDNKKTGGLYGVKDVLDNAPHKDGEWFTYTIKVDGKKITLKVDGKTTCEYTEPDDAKGGRKLDHGTIALQGHDPGSTVMYRNLKIRPLPD